MNIWTATQDEDDPLFEAWSARTKAISARARATTPAMPRAYQAPKVTATSHTPEHHAPAAASTSRGSSVEAPEKDEKDDRPAIGASLYGPGRGFKYPDVKATPAIKRKTKKLEAVDMSRAWSTLHEAGGQLLEMWSDAARAASHAARSTKKSGGDWRKASKRAYAAFGGVRARKSAPQFRRVSDLKLGPGAIRKR
jgi:hypothetical protein